MRARPLVFCLFAAALAAAGCILDSDPANRPPVIASLSAAPSATADPGDTLSLSVQADDPEGQPLTYAWSATRGDFPAGTAAAVVDWIAPAQAGPCTAKVRVDDGRNAATGVLVLGVSAPPGPPSLVIETPQPSFGLVGTRLAVVVRNGGGGALGWTAAVTTGGSWAAASPATGTVTTGADTVWVAADRAGLTPGTHYCALVVTPDTGGPRTIPLRAYVTAEPAHGVDVLATFPHDPDAFTQGLAWDRGALVEGTGHYGASELRRVELASGTVLQSVALAANEFGEGIAVVRDRVLQLTWQNHRAYARDLTTFAPLDTFFYTGEGWGLAWDGARLVMSDGSSALVFRDPDTFAELGRVTVTTGGAELERLNELECADGLVWANVWLTEFIARIDPASGAVVDWLDLTGLLTREQELEADVPNGIAIDPGSGRVFVTGKDWPLVFEIGVGTARNR
jgi:glutaminyl-peptide cyclotransferase